MSFRTIYQVEMEPTDNPERATFRIVQYNLRGESVEIQSVWEQERYIAPVSDERDTELANVGHSVAEFFEFLFPMTAQEEKDFVAAMGKNYCPECDEEVPEHAGECPECGAVWT